MISEKKICYDTTMDSLNALLNESMVVIHGAKAAAIISYDGVPIVSVLPEGAYDVETAATTATILSLAEQAILAMNTGELEYVYKMKNKEDDKS